MVNVKVVCSSNFRKPEEVDRNVHKVLKMFKKYFKSRNCPINKDSDMDCEYFYQGLSNDEVRMMKKLLNSNKSFLQFKMLKSGTSECDKSSESSDSEDSDTEKSSGSNCSGSDTDYDDDDDNDDDDDDDNDGCNELETGIADLISDMQKNLLKARQLKKFVTRKF